MTKTMQKKYARLIARVGVNIKKGQPVRIYCEADQHEFITILVNECYKAGASRVEVDWAFQAVTKLNYKHRTLKSLSEVPAWQEERLKLMVEEVPCRIYIESEDPYGLAGVNREKMQKSQMARYKITKKYSDALENKDQWCIAAVPSYAWAKRVFPNETKNKAYNMLWDAILETVYVTKDNDPEEAWKNHNANLKKRTAYLNDKKFDYLHYKSSNGTDFKAWLIPESHWCGGGETTLSGNFFNPNLPTQEVFISPKKGFAEGKVVSTKPLSWQSQIIDGFYITFKDGKAVEWDAKVGKDLLDKMLTMDDGAKYLGELALIPHDSPIANTGILFYNTLFDENASCHVALGRGFCDTIDGFEEKSLEECQALGVNDSMIHVDFMIGAPDLEITGYKDGVAYPIFKNGNWAF
ncbi:MAG: aminopeptidase [Ruminococcaceae bacterium]|nr:aminopeptidase [Oscillospiraceae bacterium]